MLDFHLQSYQNRASYEAFHGARQHFFEHLHLEPHLCHVKSSVPRRGLENIVHACYSLVRSPAGSAVG